WLARLATGPCAGAVSGLVPIANDPKRHPAAPPPPFHCRPWCNAAGIPQCFALHALRTHRSLICVGCTRPRPQGDYISIANGGNETHQKRDGQQETNMSLDNTSHPGRPEPDELVPSRYALRVGEIDVLVVSDGVLS